MSRKWTYQNQFRRPPDKMAIKFRRSLDAMLVEDLEELLCLCNHWLGAVAGEVTCKGYVDIPAIVRNTIKEIDMTEDFADGDTESWFLDSQSLISLKA